MTLAKLFGIFIRFKEHKAQKNTYKLIRVSKKHKKVSFALSFIIFARYIWVVSIPRKQFVYSTLINARSFVKAKRFGIHVRQQNALEITFG